MDFTVYDIALVPLIVVFVEVIKKVFNVPGQYLPLINIALGQAAAFVYVAPGDPKYAILAGSVMAFSAMGLWSGAKNLVEKREDIKIGGSD